METGADGVASFPRVWAGLRLKISIDRLGQAFERARKENWTSRAVFEGGAPIVVEPGQRHELHVVLPGRFRVSGRVVRTDGSAASGAALSLRSLSVPEHAPGYADAEGEADEAGRFELELRAGDPLARVRLSAAEPDPHYTFEWSAEDELHAAWRDFDAGESPVEEVLLTLAPTLAIGGRVVLPSGEEERGSLRIHPVGAESSGHRLPTGAAAWTRTGKGGQFRFLGLSPGRYDVEVTAKGRARTWARNVEAGEENLVLTLDAPRPVIVRLDVTSEVELETVIVLTGQLAPYAGLAERIAELESGVHADPLGWPRTMLGLWYGSAGLTDERGKMSFSLTSVKEFPHELELDEGLGWIGVKAKTADGDYTFPVGTGLVRLTAGEYELTFHQSPGSRLEGRILGVPPDASLFVAIATSEGRLLPLDVRRKEMCEVAELGAQGTFAFSLVPEGTHELRVGSRRELANGSWRLREPFETRRGAPVRLELEL